MDSEDNPWTDAPGVSSTSPSATGTGSSALEVKNSVVGSSPQVTMMPDGNEVNASGLLLLVFIHGFKGSAETTFEDFPNRLAHVLGETHRGLKVLPLVYPTYDTRGALDVAVSHLVEWLTMQVLSLESKPEVDPDTGKEKPCSQTGRGGGRGSVKVALLGHSMGGLVAVDGALKIAGESDIGNASAALWPRVVAVVAYDSPFFGVHPNTFRNQATKYISYAKQARDLSAHFAPIGAGLAAVWGMNRSNDQQQRQATPSGQSGGSRWAKALWAGGAFATAATAGGVAAYYNRDQINGAYSYFTDHFDYVSNLWDDEGMKARLNALVEMPSILFHAYYNYLPAVASSSARARTFIVLPPLSSQHAARLFSPIETLTAADEIDAHISMFSATRNPSGYVQLVQGSAFLLYMAAGDTTTTEQQTQQQSLSVEDASKRSTPLRPERRPRDDQREAQRRSETQGPLHREQGLRQGDESLKDEEEDVLRSMRAGRQGTMATRSQTKVSAESLSYSAM